MIEQTKLESSRNSNYVGSKLEGFYCVNNVIQGHEKGLPFSKYAPAYYMQKGGGGIQIACKIVNVLNGRPQSVIG